MASLKRSRIAQNYDARNELPREFKSDLRFDDRRARELLQVGTPDAQRELYQMYLPLVTALAYTFVRKRRSKIDESVEELISDGCVELVRVVNDPNLVLWEGVVFGGYLKTAIVRSFYKNHQNRTWGGWSKSESELMTRFRTKFTRGHGRVPTDDEEHAHLRTLITNPNIQVGEEKRRMATASSVAHAFSSAMDKREAGEDSTLRSVIDNETIRLAMKGLKSIDRQIFRLAIDGVSNREISKRCRIPQGSVHHRICGVLWEARKRADLAAHLGVEAAKEEERNKVGKYASIHRVPPARLALNA
jgi:RNA polymerase sigma factor (sigma-70 family)